MGYYSNSSRIMRQRMQYGFNVHTGGKIATRGNIEKIVVHGEKLGFSILTVPDHIVFPRSVNSKYPYGTDGKLQVATASADGNWFEPMALLSYLAAITSNLRLLSAVLVAPNRPAVLTAKLISTIDVLSEGRLIAGFGAGWLEEEFLSVSAPPFSQRGKVTDELLMACKSLWCDEEPQFHGTYTSFSNIYFAPKPYQKPHPPLWIGGEGPRSIKRAASIGNGWFPVGCNAKFPFDTIRRLSEGVNLLHSELDRNERNLSTFDVAYWAAWYGSSLNTPIESDERHLLTGSDSQMSEDILLLNKVGVKALILNFVRESLEETLDEMERFKKDIDPFR